MGHVRRFATGLRITTEQGSPRSASAAFAHGAPQGGCLDEIEAPRLPCTHGDGVALEAFVARIDRIPLLLLVSSVLLMAGMGLQIPVEPAGLASICRSRPAGAAARLLPAPATPDPAHPKTTRSTS